MNKKIISCHALSDHQMLTTIKFAHNELSADVVQKIFICLLSFLSLHTLDVSSNDLEIGWLQKHPCSLCLSSISLKQLCLPCKQLLS